jgi:hypothetical protein
MFSETESQARKDAVISRQNPDGMPRLGPNKREFGAQLGEQTGQVNDHEDTVDLDLDRRVRESGEW